MGVLPFGLSRNARRKESETRELRTKRRGLHLEQFEQRILFAISPTLVAIQPNEGDVLLENNIRSIAPRELTLRFDDGQVIDPATVSTNTVLVYRSGGDGVWGNANDLLLNSAQVYVGIGERPNEVIVRFSENLPDDFYRVTIVGSGINPLRNQEGLAFNNGADFTRNFRLDLGAQVTAVVPQPITRGPNGLEQDVNRIDVYFNADRLSSASAQNPALYQLIYTNGTATNTDDSFVNPVSATYEPQNNRVVLRFASIPQGTYRLRIGDDSFSVPAPGNGVNVMTPLLDPGSSMGNATNVGTLTGTSIVVTGQAIDTNESDGAAYVLNFPGSPFEPGHRLLPWNQSENHVDFFDFEAGITTIYYNFKRDYGFDPLGNLLTNQITETQKQRAREVFEFYAHFLGVQFVETESSGITVVTGDPRAIAPTIPTGPNGVGGIASYLGTAIMNNAVNWGNSEFGGSWFRVAMHEIGHAIGLDHAYDLPAGTIMGGSDLGFGLPAEPVFPGDNDIIHGQHLYNPESKDIDFYRFQLSGRGQFSAETIAERLPNSSLLDTVITLYNATGQVIARNDDYFSKDSFIDLELDAGVYYVAVASTGNIQNNPLVADSGLGGTSQGSYELRLNFKPIPSGSVLVDATGTRFDGDMDGRPGGTYDFWFQAATSENTIYVDKVAPTNGANGSLQNPYSNIEVALAAAAALRATVDEGVPVIVRIVGNGGADNNLGTAADNLAYEIGRDIFNQPLADGEDMEVPEGVTVMIDAGAIFKLNRANINAGSTQAGLPDSAGAALQILGTPQQQVLFTSYSNMAIGKSTRDTPQNTVPRPTLQSGNWGGLVFRYDSDYEQQGIFLNYVSHAQITYGGGSVLVDSIESVYNPIHIESSRPTILNNHIFASADAAISANPNAFEETLFRDATYTADYRRVGPDFYGNIFDPRSTLSTADNNFPTNSINGLFIRIRTEAGIPLDTLDVSARFDDTDIVHVITENLVIRGTPGGPQLVNGQYEARLDGRLSIDPGIVVKLQGARIEAGIGAQFIAEGDAGNRVIFTSLFDDRYGAGGAFDTDNDLKETVRTVAARGDWGGIYYDALSSGSLDHVLVTFAGGLVPIEGTFARFNALEIRQAEVRVTNSIFERNAAGYSGTNRNGRGTNDEATIFVRGAQPILVSNIIRNNDGDAISIDVNSLNWRSLPDYGRSTGAADLFDRYNDNQGPLVRLNRMDGNAINGMAVRGGVLTTEGVWDDTDIVHVVRSEIVMPNYHAYNGLRLKSSVNESLVVKLAGATAGFTASGTPLEISDRIGGSLWILGTPGHPVILTSLSDETVGAGFDLNGLPQNRTLGNRLPNVTGASQSNIEFRFNTLDRLDNPLAVQVLEYAARIWESILDDPINLVFDVHFETTPGVNFLAYAGPEVIFMPYDEVRDLMIADAGPHESLVSQLPTYNQLQALVPRDAANPYVIAPQMVVPMAIAKAINVPEALWDTTPSAHDGSVARDGSITINSAFLFDYDRVDDLTDVDFLATMVHEIGHALGFISIVDSVADGLRSITMTPMDMFRLAPGAGTIDFTNAERIFVPGMDAVFFDGGSFFNPDIPIGNLQRGDIPMSIVTDGFQASHLKFRGSINLNQALGIMDPVIEDFGSITEVDKRIFDLMGFDVVNRGAPGDWRGLRLDQNSNDRNVDTVLEFESAYTGANDINAQPNRAQFVGTLAANEKSGDDVRRLGFVIHGAISHDRPGDVDVYSFNAVAGTEVWFDIDRTDVSLDTVLELVNSSGQVLARSTNSYNESLNPNLLFSSGGTRVFSMQRSDFSHEDFYSTNPKDAGMRLILPGTVGTTNTYYVRVRSNSSNLNNLSGGQTSGEYQLQIRLRETDEIPGSTVRFADIRNAANAIDIIGLPAHSPLGVEATRGYTLDNGAIIVANTTFDSAQDVGNLLATDRNAIAIASALISPLDVDWYKFTLDYQAIQEIGGWSDRGWSWATIFDIDYADGSARPDLTLSVFDSLGNLIYVARDSNVVDDQPTPLGNQPSTDTTRGSFGALDPFLGSVQLPEGTSKTYYVAISSNATLPLQLNGQFVNEAHNKLLRLEPVNSIQRIVEDHMGFNGYWSEGQLILPVEKDGILPLYDAAASLVFNPTATTYADTLKVDANVQSFTLGDVTLFVLAGTTLHTVDPVTGRQETTVGGIIQSGLLLTGDLAMRSDGLLFATQGDAGNNNNFASHLLLVDAGSGLSFEVGVDGIPDEPENGATEPDQVTSFITDALAFERLAFNISDDGTEFSWEHYSGSDEHYGVYHSVRNAFTGRSHLFRGRPDDAAANIIDGTPFGPVIASPFNPNVSSNDRGVMTAANASFDPSDPIKEIGLVTGMAFIQRTGRILSAPSGARIADGQTFSISDIQRTVTFEFDTGNGVRPGNIPVLFTPADDAETVAISIEQAIGGSGLFLVVDREQNFLSLFNAYGGNSGNSNVSFFDLPSDGRTLYGVDSFGHFFTIDFWADFGVGGEDGHIVRNVTYLPGTSAWAGLTEAPKNIDLDGDGAYGDLRDTLFAITVNGDIYAIDTLTGTFRLDVFKDENGQPVDHVSTFLRGATGLAFSTLDFNLWHPTTQQATDPGHGVLPAPDRSRDLTPTEYAVGGASYYFGLEYANNQFISYPMNWDFGQPEGTTILRKEAAQFGILERSTQVDMVKYYGDSPYPLPSYLSSLSPEDFSRFVIGNNYNLPGGAHGSLVTNPFSLEGYDRTDKPVLYFNYFLETENAQAALGQNTMRDAARVFISTDDGNSWQMLATNNSVLNAELPWHLTVNSNVGSDDDRQRVQEMFDTVAEGGVLANEWRQARVDLSDFAGISGLLLRFDFSTAGDISDPSNPDSVVMPGDGFGNFGSAARGRNNDFKGFYIDDIIIGFSSRGEMVTQVPVLPANPGDPIPAPDVSFFPVPVDPVPGAPTQTLVGPYTLEIRRGTEYGIANQATGRLAIVQSQVHDVNYRYTQGISIVTPSGGAINDGDWFTLSDGVNFVTFEFNSSGGVSAGHVPINFSIGDSAQVVALKVRDAINARFNSSFRVSANVTSSLNRVDLVNAQRANAENAPTLQLQWFDSVGDSNLHRDQGMIVIQNTTISNSGQYGIQVTAGPREGTVSRPGAAGNLFVLNNERLVPGVSLSNNLIIDSGIAGIKFSGASNVDVDEDGNVVLLPQAVVPFGRILNNTIFGGGFGVGIMVTDNASPTLLNNIVSSLDVGILVDSTSATTVLGANLYHDNKSNTQGTLLGSFPITLTANDPLFVDPANRNFRLAAGSRAIDSSLNTLQDRPSMVAVSNPLGIGQSPIITPSYDLAGQLRVDDPTVASPPGLGSNVFKDRGALDRSDFSGPLARLVAPLDNDTQGFDLDDAVNVVFYAAGQPPFFEIQLDDGTGSGIDLAHLDGSKFTLLRRRDNTEQWVQLIEGVDYIFGYDTTNNVARFTPVVGLWLSGFEYQLHVAADNVNGIRDLSGNFLIPNNIGGTVVFDITIKEIDFGDAPDPTYPTLRENDGARHIIVPDRVENGVFIRGVYLGERITNDADGRPSAAADGDDGDDGVVFNNRLIPGSTASITVTASVAGFLDAWIDWNGDGVWSANEQVYVSQALLAGENDLTFNVPVTALTSAFARFRFSTAGGLSPAGPADDGEVEDYEIQIPPVVAYTVVLVNPTTGVELPKDAAGVYTVLPGQTVRADVYASDTREALAQGVYAAFVDMSYNIDSMDWIEPIVYGDSFPNFRSGSIDEIGQIVDEAGGIGAPNTPPGAGLQRVFGVTGVIKPSAALGSTFIIGLDPADDSPAHDTLVYGLNQRVAASYSSITVRINDRPWQNTTNRMDVNNDGRVSSLDALVVINRLNSAGPGQLPPPTGTNPPPFYDVNGDGMVTPIDALQIINYLNLPTITVSASTPNAAEPATAGAFTITRTGSTSQPLSVNVVLTGTATNGVDYANVASPVVIPAGSSSVVVNITPIDDDEVEGAESVILTLGTANNYKPGETSTATVTIADNDFGGGAAMPRQAAEAAAAGLPSAEPVVMTVDSPISVGATVNALLPDAAFALFANKPVAMTTAALPVIDELVPTDLLFDDVAVAVLDEEPGAEGGMEFNAGSYADVAETLFGMQDDEGDALALEDLLPGHLARRRPV